MNQSRMLAAAVSGLTLLAASAFAQGPAAHPPTSQRPDSSPTMSPATSPTTTAPASVTTSPSTTTAPTSVTSRPSSGPKATTDIDTRSSLNSDTRTSLNTPNENASPNARPNATVFGPGASQFKTIDADADGRVSRAEFTTSVSAAIDVNLDANRDGIVSAEERASASPRTSSAYRNADGTVELDPAQTFAKLDADNDGFLSESELASANARLKK
jgi:hypothetical protein